MVEEQKALVLQKYARAWMARRRFQTMRRLVLNVQLSYRVQQLRKKLEEQVKMPPEEIQLELFCAEDVNEFVPAEQREPRTDGETDKRGQRPLSIRGASSGSGGTAGEIKQPEGLFGGKREESQR